MLLRGSFLRYISPASGMHAVMYHLGDWQRALLVAVLLSLNAVQFLGSLANVFVRTCVRWDEHLLEQVS